jgi:hypothetical protein
MQPSTSVTMINCENFKNQLEEKANLEAAIHLQHILDSLRIRGKELLIFVMRELTMHAVQEVDYGIGAWFPNLKKLES